MPRPEAGWLAVPKAALLVMGHLEPMAWALLARLARSGLARPKLRFRWGFCVDPRQLSEALCNCLQASAGLGNEG
jgi:hypothetical protein